MFCESTNFTIIGYRAVLLVIAFAVLKNIRSENLEKSNVCVYMHLGKFRRMIIVD